MFLLAMPKERSAHKVTLSHHVELENIAQIISENTF